MGEIEELMPIIGHSNKTIYLKKLWYIYTMKYCTAERKKELLTFVYSMNGTRQHYAKWNKPGGKRQIPYDLTYKRDLMNKNKLMSKIEPEAWKQGTDWQQPERKGEGDNGGKKGKGLVKEQE